MPDIADFTHSEERRIDVCKGLTPAQEKVARYWMDMQDVMNRGDFVGMDDFFHPDMRYSNPNRPDLGSYASWKTSPMKLWDIFPPCLYRTVNAWGKGDDEIVVLCNHYGKHTGGRYFGKEPTGGELDTWWFSIVKMKDGKIFHIYSIADVLGMVMRLGVIPPLPANPYD